MKEIQRMPLFTIYAGSVKTSESRRAKGRNVLPPRQVLARNADGAVLPNQQMLFTSAIQLQEGFNGHAKTAKYRKDTRPQLSGKLQKTCRSAEQQDQVFGKNV